jgi:hypothetical protein
VPPHILLILTWGNCPKIYPTVIRSVAIDVVNNQIAEALPHEFEGKTVDEKKLSLLSERWVAIRFA